MSTQVSNIIGIKGKKEDVLKFLNDGLAAQSLHLDDINHDIAEEGFGKLTLRSWVPCERTPKEDAVVMTNILQIGVKYDAEFSSWECIEDDDNTVLCGYVTTTPCWPYQWFKTVMDKYLNLDFMVFTMDDCYAEVGYLDDYEGLEWVEKIRLPSFHTPEQEEFFEQEIEALKERFFEYISA